VLATQKLDGITGRGTRRISASPPHVEALTMLPSWHQDLESFEAISQDDVTKDLVLRMSAMSQAGSLGPFLFELAHDSELDEMTKSTLTEIAEDPEFLLAIEDYLNRTEILH
jgi:hypothetical protein